VCSIAASDGRSCRPFATDPSSFAPPSFIRIGAEVEFAKNSNGGKPPLACATKRSALAYNRGEKVEIKSLDDGCFTTTKDPERWAPLSDLVQEPATGNRSIWVLNTGAHAHGIEGYGYVIKNVLELMLKRISSNRDIAVFRTTPPGHPGCEKYVKPFETEDEALLTSQPGIEGYDWDMHAKYDAFLRRQLSSLSSLSSLAPGEALSDSSAAAMREKHIHSRLRHTGGAVLLDVTPMTLLRGDGHRPPGDCLHYYLPGANDYWNDLLVSTLL